MKPKTQVVSQVLLQDNLKEANRSINTNDVSFSIPDWRQQEIKNINQQFEKEIYRAVSFSLTDFDSKEEVEFMSEPKKCIDQRFAYQKKLLHPEDFSILAFILCLEQLFIAEPGNKQASIEQFKRKINCINFCCLSNIPSKMRPYYDNKIIKKILFQYINKGSYNVSLLEVLIRRNLVLKFALSLVSKSILYRRGLISSYSQKVPEYVEIRNCGDELGVLSRIKIRQKKIQTQNFLIQISGQQIKVLRKQNLVQLKPQKAVKKPAERSSTPPQYALYRQSQAIKRKAGQSSRLLRDQEADKKSEASHSSKKTLKKSFSLRNFVRGLICS